MTAAPAREPMNLTGPEAVRRLARYLASDARDVADHRAARGDHAGAQQHRERAACLDRIAAQQDGPA